MKKHCVAVSECTRLLLLGFSITKKQIRFSVLCNEKLNYEYYIEKCIGDKECSVSYKSETGHLFKISYQGDVIFITFEARIFPQLPYELIFAQNGLKNTAEQSSLRYNNS